MSKVFIAFIVLLMPLAAMGVPRDAKTMRINAHKAINDARQKRSLSVLSSEPYEVMRNAGVTVYGYGKEEGFVVMSNDDALPEMLAVSDSKFGAHHSPSFEWWMDAITEVCASKGNGSVMMSVKPDPNKYPERVDPLVSAEWSQDAPYWNMCPEDADGRCVTGCVATALAQILYTNRYPETGIGYRTIYYKNIPVVANFGETIYEYDKMIDKYNNGYTEEQANAVALLMKDLGVAVNMNYSPEGSGAYSSTAAEGMRKYFGISTAQSTGRMNYSEYQWMELIYKELSGGHPFYYGGYDTKYGGHAFVCDGYDESGRVHINWGWAGVDNGFYNVALLDPGQYSFSQDQDAVIGLYDPDAPVIDVDFLTMNIESQEAGTLRELIGESNLADLKNLTIQGPVNNDDIALLNDLASGEMLANYGIHSTGRLRKIDLTDAILENNEIPNNAFKDCKTLRNIKFPRQLTRIGDYALAGCTSLTSLTCYNYEVPKMGKRCFEGIDAANLSINLIAGSSDLYRRNAIWKTIITDDNITEFGSCLKVRNASRFTGEENPEFTYAIIGEAVNGEPYIWTEATPDSPVGKYAINIEAGTINGLPNVVYVPGTLTVNQGETGINEVSTDNNTGEAFSINGVRTHMSAGKHGLYIYNSKKVAK